jgi:hypothetical protein
MAKRSSQMKLLRSENKSYGGELLKTRKGRSTPRPLDTKNTMHVVLRSTKATGDWSFKKPGNEKKIEQIVQKFVIKYGGKIISLGNVGNHLHFQIKLANRFACRPFIRATTAAIAMAVTGASRWKPLKRIIQERKSWSDESKSNRSSGTSKLLNTNESKSFWDYRPFTKVIQSFRGFLNLRDYIEINQLEGFGANRSQARFIIADSKIQPWRYNTS